MGQLEIIIIAFGLSIDALAVSIGAGAGEKIGSRRGAFRLAFHFGLFQFFMPVLGWFAGCTIAPFVQNIDHWIAFLLLAYVGAKMMKDASGHNDEEEEVIVDPSKGKYLVMLSVATSIDAMAVGFTLAMLNINIWYPSFIIGIITGALSLLGIYSGKLLGNSFGKKVELMGGIILIAIGAKILIDHLTRA